MLMLVINAFKYSIYIIKYSYKQQLLCDWLHLVTSVCKYNILFLCQRNDNRDFCVSPNWHWLWLFIKACHLQPTELLKQSFISLFLLSCGNLVHESLGKLCTGESQGYWSENTLIISFFWVLTFCQCLREQRLLWICDPREMKGCFHITDASVSCCAS